MLCPWDPTRKVRKRAMSTQRKQYSAEFKARVALEALKGLKTGLDHRTGHFRSLRIIA
jgi:hypothetical protein